MHLERKPDAYSNPFKLSRDNIKTAEQHHKQEHRSDITDHKEKRLDGGLIGQSSFVAEGFLNFSEPPHPAHKKRDEHSTQGQKQIGAQEIIQVEKGFAENAHVSQSAV